jgi:hypothetical protein
MTKIDFEFVSTHRNRSLWPNPCLFEVSWSGNGQANGLNALDPVSNQAPTITWIGQTIALNATVISQVEDAVVVAVASNPFFHVPNYFQGAEFSVPPAPSFRINASEFISHSGGLDYVQLSVSNSGAQASDNVLLKVTELPNTLYVPAGSDLTKAYVGAYLYNETQGQSVLITDYDSTFHKVISNLPIGWVVTDQYSIRSELPLVGNFALGAGNTTSTLNLSGVGIGINPGDFARVISTGETVKIIKLDPVTNFITVSPQLSTAFAAGTLVEILSQTVDNYRSLSYTGTTVGQQEQAAYDINLVSGTIPNIAIANGHGGYPVDYPFLYVELYDTNHPSQNNLYSNNHASKSYFKVTTPTGQLVQRNERFTKFTGDLSFKNIRFRPTSNFRVVWRLPTCEEIQFEEQDTQSPYAPKEKLQTSVMFNLRRH